MIGRRLRDFYGNHYKAVIYLGGCLTLMIYFLCANTPHSASPQGRPGDVCIYSLLPLSHYCWGEYLDFVGRSSVQTDETSRLAERLGSALCVPEF